MRRTRKRKPKYHPDVIEQTTLKEDYLYNLFSEFYQDVGVYTNNKSTVVSPGYINLVDVPGRLRIITSEHDTFEKQIISSIHILDKQSESIQMECEAPECNDLPFKRFNMDYTGITSFLQVKFGEHPARATAANIDILKSVMQGKHQPPDILYQMTLCLVDRYKLKEPEYRYMIFYYYILKNTFCKILGIKQAVNHQAILQDYTSETDFEALHKKYSIVEELSLLQQGLIEGGIDKELLNALYEVSPKDETELIALSGNQGTLRTDLQSLAAFLDAELSVEPPPTTPGKKSLF